MRDRIVGLAAAAWSCACVARDVWQGVNAGTSTERPEPWAGGPLPAARMLLVPRVVIVGLQSDLEEWEAEAHQARMEYVARYLGVTETDDSDLIDEDPPRPMITWGRFDRALVTTVAVQHDPVFYNLEVREMEIGPRWRWTVKHGSEVVTGETWVSESEAKRRSEEAMVVMMETIA